MQRLLIAALLGSVAFGATHSGFELKGRVNGGSGRMFRISLHGIEHPFQKSGFTEPNGNFRFDAVPQGSYSLIVMRRSIGEIRRTVLITAAHADKKGVVRMEVTFEAAEATLNKSGGLVSTKQLAVPDKAWGKYTEAQRKISAGDVEGAERAYRQALDIYPKFAAAWNALGVLFHQQRDNNHAEEYFRKAIELDSEQFEGTVNLGGVLLGKGKMAEALPLNQKAVVLHPLDPLANAQLGMNYFLLRDFDAAEAPLLKAQSIDPAHISEPQAYLATIYLRRGERDKALEEIEAYLKIRPDGPSSNRMRRQAAQLARVR